MTTAVLIPTENVKEAEPFVLESIEKALKVTGIDKVAKKILGDDCGCEERKKKLNQMFTKLHDSKTSNPSAYRTLKDWEQLQRDADVRYGGWFEYVYDSDNVE